MPCFRSAGKQTQWESTYYLGILYYLFVFSTSLFTAIFLSLGPVSTGLFETANRDLEKTMHKHEEMHPLSPRPRIFFAEVGHFANRFETPLCCLNRSRQDWASIADLMGRSAIASRGLEKMWKHEGMFALLQIKESFHEISPLYRSF